VLFDRAAAKGAGAAGDAADVVWNDTRAATGDASPRLKVDPHLVSLLHPDSYEAGQYRRLRRALERLHASGMRVFGVTSPEAGDGKTLTAVNLAAALGRGKTTRVLLIDADLCRPAVAKYLGITPAERNLSRLMDDPTATLPDLAMRPAPLPFDVIPTTPRPAACYDTYRSPNLAQLLVEARQRYDYVVVDAPPLVTVPDSQFLAHLVDGFLLVLAAHKTSRELLAEVLRDHETLKILGLVYNGDDGLGAKYAGYPYR
jgi:capsular exopolysaccharide synthesis family protein